MLEKSTINEWIHKRQIPLGTKRPIHTYRNPPTEDDIIFRFYNPKSMIRDIVLAGSGIGKTRFMKRMVYYFHHNDQKILYFDPKSLEMIDACIYGDGERLMAGELADTLPMYPFIPSYVAPNFFPRHSKKLYNRYKAHRIIFGTSMKNIKEGNTRVFSFDLREMTEPSDWETLGIPGTISRKVQQWVRDYGVTTIAELKHFVKEDENMASQTLKATLNRLEQLEISKFFDERYPPINVGKVWREGKIPTIHFDMSRDYAANKYTVMKCCYSALNSYSTTASKLVIFDDANYYAQRAGIDAYDQCIKVMLDILVHWRALGFNAMIAVQNPDLIDSSLLDEGYDFFISNIGSYTKLRDISLPSSVLNILRSDPENPTYINNKVYHPLYSDTRRHIHEWIWARKYRRPIRFFPLGCIVGHKDSYGAARSIRNIMNVIDK